MATDCIRVYKCTIRGDRPLLMHNGQLADPLNPHTKALKAITGKRKKSDEDHLEMARLEFQGGLYIDEKIGPFIPGHALDSMLKEGARKKKLGTVFESCVMTSGDMFPLEYKGPRTREALWADERFRDRRGAGVQTSRVMRTRPRFDKWEVTFLVELFPCELNPTDIQQAITDAGMYVGFLDFRPKFGKFSLVNFVEMTDEKKAA
jgi:hypothetical protein